jgi:hypothetical protein
VGDEDDGAPRPPQPVEDGKERSGLGRREHRGGLVENQDPGSPIERARDLGALSLAHREIQGALVEGDLDADLAAELGHARARPRRAKGESPAALPEGQILGDRHRGDQGRVLVHHSDPSAPRNGWGVAGQIHGLSGELEAPGLGTHQADQDVHQRRLARAVLTEEGVHLAGAQIEID